MDIEIKKARILEATKKETENNPILQRGFVTCDNSHIQTDGPCLLSGVNPSFSKGQEFSGKVCTFPFAGAIEDPKNKGNSHWGKKRKQFGGIYKEMAYLDLFPIRETKQTVFEKSFRQEVELKKKLLRITQDEIEELHPRLIIHANRLSLYYWGIVPEYPWMGYKFERINLDTYSELPSCMTPERLKLFPFYRITGFSNNPERINQEYYPHDTALEGSFFIEYVMEYRKKEDKQKMYSADDWVEIWNWVKKHTHSPQK